MSYRQHIPIVCGTGTQVFTSNYLCNFWWWRFIGLLWWNIHPFYWKFSLSLLFLIVCRKGRQVIWTELSYNLCPIFPGLTTKQDGSKWSLQIRLYFFGTQFFSFHTLIHFWSNSGCLWGKAQKAFPEPGLESFVQPITMQELKHFHFIQRCANQ